MSTSAAVLRAIGAETRAEIRGSRVEIDGRPVGILVPYLRIDVDDTNAIRRAGIIDALGLRIRHSDRSQHLKLSPSGPIEKIVFDTAEQFRCEALTDPALIGVKTNTAAAFDRWSTTAAANNIGDTGLGLLIFTITQMLRSRLLRQPTTEQVDDLIESTRANLGRLVGHALGELPSLIDDQLAFSKPALEIARLVAEMIDDAEVSRNSTPASVERNRLVVQLDWDALEAEIAVEAGESHRGDSTDDYRIYTTAHDVECTGGQLYRSISLRKLRTELDRSIRDQAVSPSRLGQQLRPLFYRPGQDGTEGGHDEGLLDRARLAQIVADPLNHFVYRQPITRPVTDAVVSFLIDTTGSMKVQNYGSVAVLVDTYVRALEMIDVRTEVLGFSTASWAGGQSAKQWQATGSPPYPGRLADGLHIVYKSADQTWRQARHGIAAMLRTDHYREGIDGEALAWAVARSRLRPEPQRHLVMISDGLPMEASTTAHNRDEFLFDHLRGVVDSAEATGDVRLGAITLDHDMTEFFSRTTTADLSGPLTLSSYGALKRLFG